jgi:CBS domain-containing protein
VVDDEGRLVGMLTNGDLVARAGLGARLDLLSALHDEAREAIAGEVADRPVAEVMTADPATVRRGQTLAAAARVMAERKLKRLPVVDDACHLLGIVSRADVLHAVGESFPRDEIGGEHPGAVTLGEIMRTDAPTVRDDADLAALLDAVVSTRLNRAIVVDAGGTAVAVVSDAEVLRAIDPSGTSGVVAALMRTTGRAPGAAVRAGDLPGRRPLALPPETPIAEAARQMIEHGYKVLCVTDPPGRLLGIVDRADLLRAAGGALARLAGDIAIAGDDDA